MKLHQILIGTVIIGLVATGLFNFLSSGVATMTDNSNTGFTGETLELFNNNQELAQEYDIFLNNQTANANTENRQDILGAIFAEGYQQARSDTVTRNINLYQRLIIDGVGQISILGSFGGVLILALGTILSLAIGIGIFLYFIIGKERV